MALRAAIPSLPTLRRFYCGSTMVHASKWNISSIPAVSLQKSQEISEAFRRKQSYIQNFSLRSQVFLNGQKYSSIFFLLFWGGIFF